MALWSQTNRYHREDRTNVSRSGGVPFGKAHSHRNRGTLLWNYETICAFCAAIGS